AATFARTRTRRPPPPGPAPQLDAADLASAFRRGSALLAWPSLREELEDRVRRMLVVVLRVSVHPGDELREDRRARRPWLRGADERLPPRSRHQSLVHVPGPHGEAVTEVDGGGVVRVGFRGAADAEYHPM